MQFFNTEPLACDPSTLPKYPPSKEMDAKRRDDEARRSVVSVIQILYLMIGPSVLRIYVFCMSDLCISNGLNYYFKFFLKVFRKNKIVLRSSANFQIYPRLQSTT